MRHGDSDICRARYRDSYPKNRPYNPWSRSAAVSQYYSAARHLRPTRFPSSLLETRTSSFKSLLRRMISNFAILGSRRGRLLLTRTFSSAATLGSYSSSAVFALRRLQIFHRELSHENFLFCCHARIVFQLSGVCSLPPPIFLFARYILPTSRIKHRSTLLSSYNYSNNAS